MSAMSLLQVSRKFFQCMALCAFPLLVPRALLLLLPVHRRLPHSSFHHPLWLTAAKYSTNPSMRGESPTVV